MKEILNALSEQKNETYKAFMAKLLPTISPETILGVKVGDIRKIAQKLDEKTTREFLLQLPHTYLEENYLHTFLLKKKKANLDEIQQFLPYVNNWAVCDSFPIFDFENEDKILLSWLKSKETYTIRYALVNLIKKKKFTYFWMDTVRCISSESYYVNMAISWYFSMALVQEYEKTLPYFEQRKLRKIIHEKALQKAIESKQIDAEKKRYLKSIKGEKHDI